MSDRGVIKNRDYKQKIADFSGLRYGKITPTDLDCFIDFGNKLFVFVEAKYGNSPLSYGQNLALERLCDACYQPANGRYSVAFVVSHTSAQDIDMATTVVTKYRWEGKWRTPKLTGSTLRQAVDVFYGKYSSNVIPFRKVA